jgi:hypothetical protein
VSTAARQRSRSSSLVLRFEFRVESGRDGDLDGPRFLAILLEWVLGEHAAAFEHIQEEQR